MKIKIKDFYDKHPIVSLVIIVFVCDTILSVSKNIWDHANNKQPNLEVHVIKLDKVPTTKKESTKKVSPKQTKEK